MIKEEDIQNIRRQADIADIISHYIDVQKNGRNYKAVCPFHDDHDPSLSISREKQIYKCFVCGSGGNIFTFVQKYENVSFAEAVYRVAEWIGYPLERQAFEKKEVVDPFVKERRVLDEYTNFLTYELASIEGQRAHSYLLSRQFSKELIDRFQIGYAPEKEASMHFFKAKKFEAEALEKAGLVNEGRVIFSERFTIPIHDQNGKITGYTARRLSDEDDRPKYINTANTPLYNKSRLIFNYHRVKSIARKSGYAILCEGAMDVLGLEKAEIHEGLACLGTAMSDEQLNMLEKLRVPIRVWYDQDQAGKKATYHFGKLAMVHGIPFTIVKNEKGKDPDEIFCQYGQEEVRRSVESTIPYVEFLFSYLPDVYNLSNYEEKKQFANEIKDVVLTLSDPIEQRMFFEQLKSITGFDFLPMLTQPATSKRKDRQTKKQTCYIPLLTDGRKKAESYALFSMLHSKQASKRFKEEIGFFKEEKYRSLSLYIYEYYRTKDVMDENELLLLLEDEQLQNELVSLMEIDDSLYSEEAFEDCLWKIKECAISEQIELLNHEISLLLDPLKKVEFAMKKKRLIEARNEIRHRKEG